MLKGTGDYQNWVVSSKSLDANVTRMGVAAVAVMSWISGGHC